MERNEIIDLLELNKKDLALIEQNEVELNLIKRQYDQIIKGTNFVKLRKPCVLNNGIIKIEKSRKEELIKTQEEYCKSNDVIKFVPASGAASRMFKKLESFMNSDSESIQFDENKDVARFWDQLEKFPFYNDLSSVIQKNGLDIFTLKKDKNYKTILEFLLTKKGLNYSNLPKALIKFHSYKNEKRTSFEEHVVEAIEYVPNSERKVNLHFTISPEMKENFEDEKNYLVKKYGNEYEIYISFSYQKKSTDTIALDMENNLFRENDIVLFRPGGHGALIENLNELNHDLVYIKNIDNVQRQEYLSLTVEYKKLIGGLLIQIQKKIYELLVKLEAGVSKKYLTEVIEFINQELGYEFTWDENLSVEQNKNRVIGFLNRPIRVCGVVVNEGHPGGGLFWVEKNDGTLSKQIIESGQVDRSNSGQERIFKTSTHFNPVDLACSLKDFKGNKFDLTKFVDNSAVFVAIKSHSGRELKALELPGLWNGAMADWITIFVEVPKETFTPVKEVNDLLLAYHL